MYTDLALYIDGQFRTGHGRTTEPVLNPATGAPIASVIFPAATLGGVIIPLVLFHQMQLMVAAALARRYADRPAPIAAQVAEPDL